MGKQTYYMDIQATMFYFFVGHMESPKNQPLFPTSLCPPSHLLSTTNQVYGRHMCFRLHTLNLQKCPWPGSLRTHPRRMGCIWNRSRIPSLKLTVRALEKGRAPKGANPLPNQSCSMTVLVSRSLSPERTREFKGI